MSVGTSSVFWDFSQSLGPHKFYTRSDGCIIGSMKGKTPTFTDKKVEEARDLRIKGFGGSGHLTKVLKSVIHEGYREVVVPKSAVNLFVEDNALTLCKGVRNEEGKLVCEYDYLVMRVAGGSLDGVNVTATLDEETRVLAFEQDGEVVIGGLASADDQLCACIFESVQEKVALEPLRPRGDHGNTSFLLPKGWDPAVTFAYVFAVSANRKLSSPSSRVYPAPTEGEKLAARLAALEEQARRERVLTREELNLERQERQIEAIHRANAASEQARTDAVTGGKSPAVARMIGRAAYDAVMDEAHEEEARVDEEIRQEEERLAAAKKERAKAAGKR